MNIVDRVKIITQLKIGETIDPSTGLIWNTSYWSTSGYRLLSGQSHVTTCNYIIQIVDETIVHVNLGNIIGRVLKPYIPDLIKGLRTYMETTSSKPYKVEVERSLQPAIDRLQMLLKSDEPISSTEPIPIQPPVSSGPSMAPVVQVETITEPIPTSNDNELVTLANLILPPEKHFPADFDLHTQFCQQGNDEIEQRLRGRISYVRTTPAEPITRSESPVLPVASTESVPITSPVLPVISDEPVPTIPPVLPVLPVILLKPIPAASSIEPIMSPSISVKSTKSITPPITPTLSITPPFKDKTSPTISTRSSNDDRVRPMSPLTLVSSIDHPTNLIPDEKLELPSITDEVPVTVPIAKQTSPIARKAILPCNKCGFKLKKFTDEFIQNGIILCSNCNIGYIVNTDKISPRRPDEHSFVIKSNELPPTDPRVEKKDHQNETIGNTVPMDTTMDHNSNNNRFKKRHNCSCRGNHRRNRHNCSKCNGVIIIE